ncbi:MAG: DNA repair protein RecO [Gammaproteobacteria bacterium]
MSGRVTLVPAWILHTRPYRDTSLLIEALCEEHGRTGLIARGVRGARGARGRWRGLLQPLQPLLLSWSGRGELSTVAGCEPAGPAVPLRDEALLSALYMNEVLLRVLQRGDPQPAIFQIYGDTVAGLAGTRGAVALRLFEKRLLDALGWGAAYDHAADDGTAVDGARRYGFTADRGVLATAPGAIEVAGDALLALAREDLTDPLVMRDARRVLSTALAPHLGDRPLETRKLLKEWRKNLG